MLPENEGEPENSSDWHKLARERKKKAGLFLCVADLDVRLACAGLVFKPAMNFLYRGLDIAGRDYELLQMRRAANHGERSFRILEAAAETSLKSFWAELGTSMAHWPIELADQYHTERARSMIFRCLSGLLCNITATVRESHRAFPIKLFKLLLGEQEAAEVYKEPKCMWDEVSTKFFTMYPTVELGRSNPALAFLEHLAYTAELASWFQRRNCDNFLLS